MGNNNDINTIIENPHHNLDTTERIPALKKLSDGIGL